MRTKHLFRVIIAAVVVSGASLTAAAQQQASQTDASQKQKAKPAPAKSAKVWGDDDLTSLRSPADIYAQQQQREAAAAATAASAKQQSVAKAGNPADPSPGRASGWKINTPDDAQKAIDWDDRDIATQKQLAANLQKQLDTAPADQKARLQKALEERLQIIAGTQKDRDVIAVQKEKIEKKPTAGSNAPASPPPSQ